MRHFLGISASLLVLGLAGCGGSQATVKFINTNGERIGTATLTEVRGQGVKIYLILHHLPPGTHAFHIHEKGVCNPPDFASAGPHFNPYGKQHGVKNPNGAHAGDLPNLVVGPDGSLKTEILAVGVTLRPGVNSLRHPGWGGTAWVIHANPDDDMTDPAGNAGARIGCGVISES